MGLVSVPYTFSPNTTAQSGQVNGNFSALVNFINTFCAIVNNVNTFTAGVTILTPSGLTVGNGSNLSPLNVNGTVTFNSAGSPQSMTEYGAATFLSGGVTVGSATSADGLTVWGNGLFESDLAITNEPTMGGVKWPFPAGTPMLFGGATAPPGWTQDATKNDAMIRVVSGAGGATGGSWVISGNFGSTDGHVLAISEIPSHSHGIPTNTANGTDAAITFNGNAPNVINNSNYTGGGGAHSHTLTAVSSDGVWRPAYVNMMWCTKN